MQLTAPRGTLRASLMSASCALLGTHAGHAEDADAGAVGSWQSDSALLYYKEADGRVQAVEPVVSLKRDFGDEHVLSLKLTYDSLSGGSPNGALPSSSPQTFATPSGSTLSAGAAAQSEEDGQSMLYTVPAGTLPLSKFQDERAAANVGWSQPLGRAWKYSVGADFSNERDFTSAGVNAAIARDFFQRNTTLSLGGAFESDSIRPIGGTPVAGSDYALLQKGGNESKTIASVLLGVTQVMTRRWLVQFNLSADSSQGYQTDPYKITSVLDAAGNTTAYYFERRPDRRTRQAAYLENRIAFGRDTLALSLRYMKDDWGIRSSTADLHYRLEFSNGMYVEPHARYYRQDAAEFYHLYLPAGSPAPDYFSADSRLAAFDAVTAGLKIGMPLRNDAELSLRLETYRQTGRNVEPGFGQIAGLDLYPGLNATIAQFSLRF
jgi:hypothetical protein